MRCVILLITGKVQGVSFRDYAKKKARELGLAGFVRNEPDGSVRVEAEGEEKDVEEFIRWCREGSPEAEAADVKITRQPLHDFQGFEIRQ
jgi:acylphosphatase